MTYDAVAPLARFANQARIGFPLLADRGSKIIGGIDLIDESQPKTASWYGLATPMIVVLDADGVVRHRFSTRDYRQRPDVDTVLGIIGGKARR